MKRTTLIALCAWLSAMALQAQSDASSHNEESDDEGLQLTIIPRVDINPSISTGNGESADNNWFTPTLYTVFEGNLSEHVSFYLSNHWLTYHPEDLYHNTFHSDLSSWVDQANVNYNFDNGLSVGLGKFATAYGIFEEDEDDWNAHSVVGAGGSILASSFWNNMMVYEWGLNVSYESEGLGSITAQVLSSPYGEKPFKSKLYSYNLQLSGGNDVTSAMIAGTLHEVESGKFATVLSLGVQHAFNDLWTGTLDGLCYWDYNEDLGASKSTEKFYQAQASLKYAPSEKFDIMGRVGYEHGYSPLYGIGFDEDVLYGGVSANYYPLNNQDLRIHGTAALHNQFDEAWLSFGATYFFNLFK